jgi:hypothetical protein
MAGELAGGPSEGEHVVTKTTGGSDDAVGEGVGVGVADEHDPSLRPRDPGMAALNVPGDVRPPTEHAAGGAADREGFALNPVGRCCGDCGHA